MLTHGTSIIRLACFIAVFTAVALWEHKSPRRKLTVSKKNRWIANLTFTIGNPLLLRLLFPILAVDMAVFAREHGWGLLNLIELPHVLELAAGVIFLDFVIYIQHVVFHAIPLLWRLHRVHHADLDYDLTTGLRFHPIEIILSMGVKITAICALGPSVVSVLIFEVILNGMAMFNHGNIKLPVRADGVLRWFVVTPDMHRVHHSVIVRETNSNFGFNLSWWDHLFGTYRAQPAEGHRGMTIGLSQYRDPKLLTLPRLLVLPFIGDVGKQPINR
jgi:sterol desaturase/sphingolipid hydroxylase (fatty acid hydroxylase superfamily)